MVMRSTNRSALRRALVRAVGSDSGGLASSSPYSDRFVSYAEALVQEPIDTFSAAVADTNIYVDPEGGNDANSGLTHANRVKTFAEAQSIADALWDSNGSTHMVFINVLEGTLCQEIPAASAPANATACKYLFYAGANACQVHVYKAAGGAPTSKARFSVFIDQASGTWTSGANGIYTMTSAATAFGFTDDVFWVKDSADAGIVSVFTKEATAAACESNPLSFHYNSATDVLTIHPGDLGIPDSAWTVAAAESGKLYCAFAFRGNNSGVDGQNQLVFQGFGLTSDQLEAYACSLYQSGTDVGVLRRFEDYYFGDHGSSFNSRIDVSQSLGKVEGGVAVFDSLTGGGGHSTSSISIFNSFNSENGQTTYWKDCKGVLGGLTDATASIASRASIVYAHGSGGGGAERLINIRPVCESGSRCQVGVGITRGAVTNVNSAKSWVIGARSWDNDSTWLNTISGNVWVDCDFYASTGTRFSTSKLAVNWILRSYIHTNHTATSGDNSWVNYTTDPAEHDTTFEFCFILIQVLDYRMFMDARSIPTGTASGIKIFNSVIAKHPDSGTGQVSTCGDDNPELLSGNAFLNITHVDNVRAYTGTPHIILSALPKFERGVWPSTPDFQTVVKPSGPIADIEGNKGRRIGRYWRLNDTIPVSGDSYTLPLRNILTATTQLDFTINNNGVLSDSTVSVASRSSDDVTITFPKDGTYTLAVDDQTTEANLTLGVSGIPAYTLDALTTEASSAFSLRKVRYSYSGSAIRVRRSSDNAEQDIGFDGVDLDTAALLAFVGSGSGYIRTWYDQSRNSRDIGQATTGQQPIIVDTGSLITAGGKASIRFDGTNDNLFRSDAFLYSAGASTVLAILSGASQPSARIVAEGWSASDTPSYSAIQANGSGATAFLKDDGSTIILDGSTSYADNIFTDSIKSLGVVDDGSQLTMFANDVEGSGVSYTRGTLTLNRFAMGCLYRAFPALFFNGEISEVITFGSALTTERATATADQISYYGVS